MATVKTKNKRAFNRRMTVMSFIIELIEICRRNNRLGTARNYDHTMNSFLSFLDGRDIPFKYVNDELMVEYEKWLVSRGIVRNSSSFYMRNLRSIYNKAVKRNLVEQSYPFRNVYTGIDHTRKRAVSEDTIVRLQRMDLEYSQSLAMARDLFVFSYCTRGMAFVDVAFLKKEDINDGVISYIRRKTGQQLSIRIEPCMEKIICQYEKETENSPYVFPIITAENPEDAYMQYHVALTYYNRKLKRLAKELGERASLSSYTARHTWATTARKYNVPISVISAGMGHTSEKTTQIYLAALDNSVIDQANQGIIRKLNDIIST